ncbi:glycosyltransferase [Macrococcoides caseolyticum]|uniref:Uncharacterized protein n=1 Tax=Macrococcoides caseolyticum TaxID=69966 RepID=A0ACC9MUR9_9STAP|nr:glycosyltransferase [Macrococcus caseolyticus]PKE20290.1 hypothetical protein CW679_00095 [Macrococcus caseolyticus]PKE40259.1 hypothetical protein CW675_02750 [Macrococcus caseolyticus]PKE57427.1 hypothetical protein CW682_02095 [Macrococcus caseolyticus]PKF41244.1 hypothetical protein CW661_02400 [Macrococcus caseolyticus]QQB05549.1 glycosyltransferase [Macrococcus caseolyticus]
MKILFSATVLSHIKAFHLPYIDYFIDRGHSVSVIAKNDSEDAVKELKKRNVEIINIDIERSIFTLKTIKSYNQIHSFLKNNNFDLITTHTPIISILTRLANHKLNKNKMMYTAHGFHFYKGGGKLKNIVFRSLEKYFSKYTDALVTMNNEDYNSAKSFHMKKLYKVNGIGVDTKHYTPENSNDIRLELGLQENEIGLVYLAELSDRKNQNFILSNWNKIQSKNDKIKLFLVGDGNNKEAYINFIKDNNLKNIELLGYRADVQDILYSMDGVVLLSKHEGLPRCLLEGMALNKMLIASDIRGNNDLIENNKNGYLIKLTDDKKLIHILGDIVNNKEKVKILGNYNKNLISKYDINNVLNEHIVIYKDMLGDKL